jgi:PAS domain S-box-containing protein
VAAGSEAKQSARQQARLELFATALDLSSDAVFLVDRETMRFVDVNRRACELLGLERDELLQREPHVNSPDLGSLDQLRAAYDAAIADSPNPQEHKIDMLRSDGTTVPCEVRRQAIRSEERWIIVATARDITEQRRAEAEIRRRVEELTRSNHELEQFAYITSHDLSEPLRMVASYTQLLERRYAAHFDQDAREFMGFIVGGAQRMKQLIDDLLTYSRAGRAGIALKELALDLALDDALANLAHAVRTTGATIEREPLPTILADRSGMVQVFQNIVGNAIKFRHTERPPVVSVWCRDAGPDWMIAIEDNGIGIAPEYFERIFAVFQRLHPRQDYEGTGIGLAICKKVIERHKGQIIVDSTPGKGATFRLWLPKAPAGGSGPWEESP